MFSKSVITVGVADHGMDIGGGTGLDLVLVGAVVHIVRGRVTGTAIAVIGTIAVVIVAIAMDGGIRSPLLVLARLLVVRLPLLHLHGSIARLLTVTAMRISSGAITVTGPIGLRTIVSSHITDHVSSVIHRTDNGYPITESIF